MKASKSKTSKISPQDITGMIGDLYPKENPEYAMYSYSRPAYLFWQGFYEGLLARGFTHKKAIEEMQSKGPRWMFDGDSESVKQLGFKMAKNYTSCLN